MENTLIIGAGPAGLTAAYELDRLGYPATILEADEVVGGISRTINHEGYRFDVGGHRFFSKNEMLNTLWAEMLGEAFLVRPRMSRIHYDGHFYDYPLKLSNTLRGLGLFETIRIGLSYLHTRFAPSHPELTFEQWVSNRFGWRLYEIFFKTYTEKVWGIPCSEISADWATQRIKNLTLTEILRNLFYAQGRCKKGKVITTLIEQFDYPRFGPGMMWECFEVYLRDHGVPTEFDRRVERIEHGEGRVHCLVTRNRAGESQTYTADHYLSSMPLRELIENLDPAPPAAVLAAAQGLRYRDFLTVVLMVDREDVFPDNWIYIHSPDIRMGRIQNYKNWSPDMVPDLSKTSLGLEYFVSEDEPLWSHSDDELIELGIRECTKLGFVTRKHILGGTVFRMKKAYPVYDLTREGHVSVIRAYLDGLKNLQAIGRNGQHHYNNMDHSMLTGIYAARTIAGQTYDVWSVNAEKEYHETKAVELEQGREQAFADALKVALARLDPIALGAAVGVVCGVGVFLATIVLLLKGGDVVGPRLALLKHFLIGYRVTWVGALVGWVDGTLVGFCIGFACAWLHNHIISVYILWVRWRAEMKQGRDLLS